MESSLPYPTNHFGSTDEYISSLLAFTSTAFFRKLVGGVHILDFFTSSPILYEAILPLDWRDYFEQKSIDDILELLLRTDLGSSRPDGVPDSLYEFASSVQKHELKRNFYEKENKKDNEDQGKLKRRGRLAAGMNDKKFHEVEHFANYLSTFLESLAVDSSRAADSITHVVDFGAGQAYLSRILASPPHNLNLVAVESKESNIEAGKSRDTTVGLGPSSQSRSLRETIVSTNEEQKRGSIQYVQHFIQDESVKEILDSLKANNEVSDDIGGKIPGLMIISLHSCGNLIHHALNALLSNEEVKAVAVVGCCYNLMTERSGPTYKPPYQKYSPSPQITSESCNHHFPLSSRLASQETTLNITARMMACQAPRNWTTETSSNFFKRHFYRALMQRIFFDKGILSATEPLIIGSLRKQAYVGFWEYVTAAVKKILNASTDADSGSAVAAGVKERIKEAGLDTISREEVKEYEDKYEKGLKQLSVMWTLMAFCAGCVESLIVVDRWCYLVESGKCKVVKVEAAFEYSVSPRNFVVVGVK